MPLTRPTGPPVPALVAFSILGPITIHLILPTLPVLQGVFGADFATTQLLVSFFVVAFGGGQVLVGPLSDLYGKRRVLVAGMALFAGASVLCALAPDIRTLIGLRILQGFGACTGTVLSRAIIRDHHQAPQSTRILGYLAMGIAIGPIIAPTLGGVMFQAAGWRAPFWVLAALGLGNLVLAWHLLPATPQAGPGGGLAKLAADIRRLLRDAGFLGAWLAVCFNAGTAFTFMTCAPLVGQHWMGLTPTAYGLWSSTGALGYIAGNYLAGRLAGRIGADLVLLAGALGVVAMAGLLALTLAQGAPPPALVFGAFAVLMAASGLVMPNAYAGAMAAVPDAAGSASGFVGFAQFAIGAVFATLASHLVETRQDPVYLGLVMLGAALGGTLVALVMLRRRGA